MHRFKSQLIARAWRDDDLHVVRKQVMRQLDLQCCGDVARIVVATNFEVRGGNLMPNAVVNGEVFDKLEMIRNGQRNLRAVQINKPQNQSTLSKLPAFERRTSFESFANCDCEYRRPMPDDVDDRPCRLQSAAVRSRAAR